MKPLIILIVSFCISLLATRYIGGSFDYAPSGRIAMSVMLLFTAWGHFRYSKGMAMMLPAVIQSKVTVIYLTGFIEVGAAIGLLIPRSQVMTAWLLIIFFIGILPANIYAALNKINLQTGKQDGKGPAYLWFRVPLQIFFILWTYFSAVR